MCSADAPPQGRRMSSPLPPPVLLSSGSGGARGSCSLLSYAGPVALLHSALGLPPHTLVHGDVPEVLRSGRCCTFTGPAP